MLRANPKKGRKSSSMRVESPLGDVIGEMKMAGGSDSLKPVAIAQAGQPPAGAGPRRKGSDATPKKSASGGGLAPPRGHKRSTSTGHRLKAEASTKSQSTTVGTTVVRSQPHFATPGIQNSPVLHSSSNIPIPQPRPVSDEQLQQLYLQMYFHFHLSK